MNLIGRTARVVSLWGAVAIATAVMVPSALADSGSGTQTFSDSPTAATGTATTPAAGYDYCVDSAVVNTPGGGEAWGSGRTTCTEGGSFVESVTLTFWEKKGSGYVNLGGFHPAGGPTPYFTGIKTVRCTSGDYVHVFYATRVLTPDGVYISDPGANTTAVKC